MATWPGGLPIAPKLAGLQYGPGDRTLRTQMDAGPAKVRRRFSVAVDQVPVTIDLTAAQLATFRTFFTTTLLEGSLPFTWTDHTTGAARDFRFVGTYRIAAVAPRTGPSSEIRHRVAFTLETVPS